MQFEVHVFLHAGKGSSEHLHGLLHNLINKVDQMSDATNALKAAVEEQAATVERVVSFIQGVPDLVAEAVRKALEDAGVGGGDTDAAVAEAEAAVRANTIELEAALLSSENPPVEPIPVDPEPEGDDINNLF